MPSGCCYCDALKDGASTCFYMKSAHIHAQIILMIISHYGTSLCLGQSPQKLEQDLSGKNTFTQRSAYFDGVLLSELQAAPSTDTCHTIYKVL